MPGAQRCAAAASVRSAGSSAISNSAMTEGGMLSGGSGPSPSVSATCNIDGECVGEPLLEKADRYRQDCPMLAKNVAQAMS